MKKIIEKIKNTRDFENLKDRLGKELGELILELIEEAENACYVAYCSLPNDCLQEEYWEGEIKFCSYRQGEGNACKKCSNYN